MSFGVVFPGQGSQRVGMLEEAAGAFSIVAETFDEASDALGYNLWQLVSEGPEEKLGLTEYTQPAILTASVACTAPLAKPTRFSPQRAQATALENIRRWSVQALCHWPMAFP